MHDLFWLGVNYWPRDRGLLFWDDWDPQGVERDLAEIRGLGLRYVRVFLLWRSFQPAAGTVSAEALARLDRFLDLAGRHGLLVIPTLFTGHMSGTNWDVPWRGGRSPYRDPSLLRSQAGLVAALARRYRDDARIACWDLANEPDVFVPPDSADDGWLWTRFLAGEFRAGDPIHPVTLGIHQASLLADNGFRPADVAESVDFMCMHMYPFYSDVFPDPLVSLRSLYSVPCAVRLTEGMSGKRVLAEEYGTSALLHGERRAADYTRSVLWSLLLTGARGAVAWCFTDPARPERSPYDENPYEVGFGLVDAYGRPRAAALAFRDAARALAGLGERAAGLRPLPPRAAIVIPHAYYEAVDPDLTPERHFRVLLNAYVLCRQAGLAVDFLPAAALAGQTGEGLLERYGLIILPSLPRRGGITVSQWVSLRDYVRAGGVLYCSYDGAALPGMEEVFGVSPEDAIPFVPPGRKRLLFSLAGARVLSRIGDEPVLTVHECGAGRALFLSFPLELALSYVPDAFGAGADAAADSGLDAIVDAGAGVGTAFSAIYRQAVLLAELGRHAGSLRPVITDDPYVEAGILGRNGSCLIVVNHRPGPAEITLRVAPGVLERDTRLVDVLTGTTVQAAEPEAGSPAATGRLLLKLQLPAFSPALLVPASH